VNGAIVGPFVPVESILSNPVIRSSFATKLVLIGGQPPLELSSNQESHHFSVVGALGHLDVPPRLVILGHLDQQLRRLLAKIIDKGLHDASERRPFALCIDLETFFVFELT
jgi:hypothetical protein